MPMTRWLRLRPIAYGIRVVVWPRHDLRHTTAQLAALDPHSNDGPDLAV